MLIRTAAMMTTSTTTTTTATAIIKWTFSARLVCQKKIHKCVYTCDRKRLCNGFCRNRTRTWSAVFFYSFHINVYIFWNESQWFWHTEKKMEREGNGLWEVKRREKFVVMITHSNTLRQYEWILDRDPNPNVPKSVLGWTIKASGWIYDIEHGFGQLPEMFKPFRSLSFFKKKCPRPGKSPPETKKKKFGLGFFFFNFFGYFWILGLNHDIFFGVRAEHLSRMRTLVCRGWLELLTFWWIHS